MESIAHVDIERVRIYLFHGTFDLISPTTSSISPLELASQQKGANAVEIVEILLAHRSETIDEKILFRMLMTAAMLSQLSMVQFLTDRLPNFASQRTNDGENILHASVRNHSAGSGIIANMLHHHNLHALLWEKNNQGHEPHLAFHRVNCKTLKVLLLNGSNFSGAKIPSFADSCSSGSLCPMRLAQKILALLNYKLDVKVQMELDFHETKNQLLGNLTDEIQALVNDEFYYLTSQTIYNKKTLFDFLVSSRSESIIFAKNADSIRYTLARQDMTFCRGLIKAKLMKAQERLDLFEDSKEGFAVVIFQHLPRLIFKKLSGFLNNNDLRNLIRAELVMHD